MKRLLAILLVLLLLPATTRGQDPNRAGLVVQWSDGSVETYCVAFPEASISSLELLQRAKLDVIAQTSGNNAAVCKIEEDGCDFPAESCFCNFGGGQRGEYWAFWQLVGGAWSYSTLGAGVARVEPGDVNGWAWGSGSAGRGVQPPVYSFDQICSATEQATGAGYPLATEAGEQETDSAQSAIRNPQSAIQNSVNYVLFGMLLLVSLGMIMFVARRGTR